eukprot:TRINITY_DN4977_c0_g1_i1.p1 TRINITY_DN4977_c0_g1~~TRINITY_DN4977_c0_g1_i1.p1  ORF type:complete len:331 (+),score=107.68 TRINITY_DN4977_c0_g1_i1:65-1057(+)
MCIRDRKKVDAMLEKERERREKEKKMNEQVIALFGSPEIQMAFARHEKQLKYVFQYYLENIDLDVRIPYTMDHLQYKGFMVFAAQFNLFPGILSTEQIGLAYRSVSLDKKLVDKIPVGLSYDDFLQVLFRIAVKGSRIFNQVQRRFAADRKADGGSVEAFVKEEKKNAGEAIVNEDQASDVNYEENAVDKTKTDEYTNLGDTNVGTLEGLLLYLNLPEERKALIDRLRELKAANSKLSAAKMRKDLKLKLDGPAKNPEPRDVSVEKKAPAPVKPNREPPRRNEPPPKAQQEEEPLEAVDVQELKKEPAPKSEDIIGPDGKKENWKITENE